MKLEDLTIADFESLSSSIVQSLDTCISKCEVKANYLLGLPRKVEIQVSYNNNILNENILFTQNSYNATLLTCR